MGTVSLARDGKDCKDIDPRLWKVSLAEVILSWILIFSGGSSNARASLDEDSDDDSF